MPTWRPSSARLDRHGTRPYYSHAIRWRNTAAHAALPLTTAAIEQPAPAATASRSPLPPDFDSWSHLGQAQYLEIVDLPVAVPALVAGRPGGDGAFGGGPLPFLDYRVVEFCNRLPPDLKLRGLTEK